MDSERLFVTVECDGSRLDASLPADVPVADLVPQLLSMLGMQAGNTLWVLAGEDGEVLPGNRSLLQSGLEEGAHIRLRDSSEEGPPAAMAEHAEAEAEAEAEAQPEPAPPIPQEVPEPLVPSRRMRLPIAPPFAARVRAVAEAVVSSEPGAGNGHDGQEPLESATAERLRIKRPRSVLERAEAVWRSSNHRYQLDEVIRAPRLTSAATIAVVSPKGGVGKTTTAAVLGTLLAMLRSDRVVAVDSNPDYGTLGRILTPDHAIFVDDLLSVLHQPALTVTMLERCLGRAQHGLLVLPAPTDPGRMERLDDVAYERVIRRLQELAGILVLDCAAGLQDPVTKVALASANQLVLVSDADPVTASMVAEAALRLPPETSFTFVVNKVPRSGSRLNVRHLAEDIPSARGVIEIETNAAAAARVTDGEFNWNDAPDSWQVGFRELAGVLATEWASLGLTD